MKPQPRPSDLSFYWTNKVVFSSETYRIFL